MPTITHIETAPHIVPMKAALKWGKGHQLNTLNHIKVTVRLSDGAQGTAEATPRPTIYGETPASIEHIIAIELFPRIEGAEINSLADIDTTEKQLRIVKNNNCAKGALNMALHEALAQSQGQSLANLLGITQTRIMASYIVSTGTPDAVLADVQSAYECDVRCFKVKIGADIASEVATLKQMAQHYTDAIFYADANQTLTLKDVNLLDDLHQNRVAYCEEPLPVHHLQERQALRQQTTMPLIGDDSCFTLADVQRELALNTVDILNIKTARNGFSEARAIAQLAYEHDKGIMVGSQASSIIGCRHAALFALASNTSIPCECSFFLKTETDAGLPLHSGYITLADLNP